MTRVTCINVCGDLYHHCNVNLCENADDDENHLFCIPMSSSRDSADAIFVHMKAYTHAYINISELGELANKIDTDYYQELGKLCESMGEYIKRVSGQESGEISGYLAGVSNTHNRIGNHIKSRQEVLMPYVEELFEKKTIGHNCIACSSNCDVQHSLKMHEFRVSVNDIKNILNYIQDELSAPEDIQSSEVENLAKGITLVNNMLTELTYLEEEILIPKILEAQKLINARS